jgi:AcrR family transcriptional regulator
MQKNNDESVSQNNGAGLNRPKQFEASREEFLTAAMSLFSEKGFHEASVDDIVAKAGRSKGGFYHHFQSKDQVFIEVFDQVLGNSLSNLAREMQSGGSIRELLFKLINQFEPMMTNAEHMRATTDFMLHSLRNPEAAKIIQFVHRKLVERMSSLFALAIEKGEFHRGFDPVVIAEVMLASGRGIVITGLVCDQVAQIPDRMRAYTEMTLGALEARRED